METSIPRNLILHGTWRAGAFFVWGESSQSAPRRRGGRPRIPPHPYAAPADVLRAALETLIPHCDWSGASPVTRAALLPSGAKAPCLPPWLVPTEGAEEAESELRLSPWRLGGLALDPLSAPDLLVALPAGAASGRHWGADLRYRSLVAKRGLELLAQHKYLPGLTAEEGKYRGVWLPVLSELQDRARLRVLAQAMPAACRAVFVAKETPALDCAPPPDTLLDSFLKHLVDRAVRHWSRDSLDKRRTPPAGVAGAWWSALWSDDNRIDLPTAQRREMARLFDDWQAWMGQLRGEADATCRVCFRLEPPVVDAETGRVQSPDWTVDYLLQASDDPSLLVPAGQVWKAKGSTLRVVDHRFEGAQERLLAGLGLAGRLFPPIMASLRAARPEACRLTVDEAYAFLREVGALLKGSGFGVLVPPWWDKPGARLGVRAKARTEASGRAGSRLTRASSRTCPTSWR